MTTVIGMSRRGASKASIVVRKIGPSGCSGDRVTSVGYTTRQTTRPWVPPLAARELVFWATLMVPRRFALAILLAPLACGPSDFGGRGVLAPESPRVPPAPTARAESVDPDGIPIVVTADKSDGKDVAVSLGVPFPPGKLASEASLALTDAGGASVPRDAKVLARWPTDGSIRSVLVAFRATLGPGAAMVVRLAPKGKVTKAVVPPNPDGPFVATLPSQWYADARATGASVPVARDTRFPLYEAGLERGLAEMQPTYESHGNDCEHTTNHRTYYDGPHGFFQRFVRSPSPATYRRARAESTLYRARELRFMDGRAMAVQVCERKDWTPARPLDWSVMRRMTGQGMLDDYVLTGDPAARESIVAMGEAFKRDLHALFTGHENTLRVTERNMGWALMGLAAYYAVDPRPEVKKAMTDVADDAFAWQALGKSGAFEHDIARPDPDECEKGPRGGSPFMASILVDALMDYRAVTGDARVAESVRRLAGWLEKDAVTSDGKAFRYLWGCIGDPMDDSGVADLNLLIVHVFGAAFDVTGDRHWLTFGDKIADAGLDAMSTKNPKQWNQAARAFARYLGYRAKGLPP